jgi:uncharacterized protein
MKRRLSAKKNSCRIGPRPRDLISRIKADAKNFFQGARGSHDWDHTERVLRLCLRIGKKENADVGILKPAAILHDIGRAREDRSSGKICHSEAGAEMALDILASHDIEKEKIDRILHCIRSHRFRKGADPLTIEAKVLFDADKLDSIGAVGIGRAFLFAGEVGARLHNKGVDVGRTKPYTKEDTAYREYMVKLRLIKDRMFTAEGKRIARERHDFMVKFFDRLDKETEGEL